MMDPTKIANRNRNCRNAGASHWDTIKNGCVYTDESCAERNGPGYKATDTGCVKDLALVEEEFRRKRQMKEERELEAQERARERQEESKASHRALIKEKERQANEQARMLEEQKKANERARMEEQPYMRVVNIDDLNASNEDDDDDDDEDEDADDGPASTLPTIPPASMRFQNRSTRGFSSIKPLATYEDEMARKEESDRESGASLIQRRVRGLFGRQTADKLKKEKEDRESASSIQRQVRGFFGRQRADKLKKEKEESDRRKAREEREREEIRALNQPRNELAPKLFFRGDDDMDELDSDPDLSLDDDTSQSEFEDFTATQSEKAEKELNDFSSEYERSSTSIQKNYRGSLARRETERRRAKQRAENEKRAEGALAIQRFLARRKEEQRRANERREMINAVEADRYVKMFTEHAGELQKEIVKMIKANVNATVTIVMALLVLIGLYAFASMPYKLFTQRQQQVVDELEQMKEWLADQKQQQSRLEGIKEYLLAFDNVYDTTIDTVDGQIADVDQRWVWFLITKCIFIVCAAGFLACLLFLIIKNRAAVGRWLSIGFANAKTD